MLQMQQQNKQKAYSRSLRHIIATSPAHPHIVTERGSPIRRSKQQLKDCLHELQQSRRRYDHQIDHLVRELAHKEGLPVELPFLQRKNSYHNYRILSHRPHPHPHEQEDTEDQEWRRQVQQLEKEKRTKTEPREIDLSKERDKVYAVVKHYREGSLKQMELHLNLNQLRKWHEHNRNLAMRRQAQTYKLPKKKHFHQLQIHT